MTPTKDDIEKRAYAIWQREGQPEGRDAEHWLMAERELAGESAVSPSASPRAGSAKSEAKPALVRSRPRKSGT